MRASFKRCGTLVFAGVLMLSACSDPEEKASGEPAKGDFKACLVTNGGSINDHGFNQAAWEGLQAAMEKDSSIAPQFLDSASEADFTPNINAFVAQDCDLIITNGFATAEATGAAAAANPDTKFAIVDWEADPKLPNLAGLTFETIQAGYLGGYLAAGMSKTGKTGLFAGIKLPSVTLYFDGFVNGVDHYNQEHGTDVEVVGWNPDTQDGTFVGNFTDQVKGAQITEGMLSEGVDVIFGGGGLLTGAIASTIQKSAKGEAWAYWVNTDGCDTAPQYCDVILASVVKGVSGSVETVAVAAAAGDFTGGNIVGDVANEGVSVILGKDAESTVPDELKSELEDVKTQLADGEIDAAARG